MNGYSGSPEGPIDNETGVSVASTRRSPGSEAVGQLNKREARNWQSQAQAQVQETMTILLPSQSPSLYLERRCTQFRARERGKCSECRQLVSGNRSSRPHERTSQPCNAEWPIHGDENPCRSEDVVVDACRSPPPIGLFPPDSHVAAESQRLPSSTVPCLGLADRPRRGRLPDHRDRAVGIEILVDMIRCQERIHVVSRRFVKGSVEPANFIPCLRWNIRRGTKSRTGFCSWAKYPDPRFASRPQKNLRRQVRGALKILT